MEQYGILWHIMVTPVTYSVRGEIIYRKAQGLREPRYRDNTSAQTARGRIRGTAHGYARFACCFAAPVRHFVFFKIKIYQYAGKINFYIDLFVFNVVNVLLYAWRARRYDHPAQSGAAALRRLHRRDARARGAGRGSAGRRLPCNRSAERSYCTAV